jgi:hypothetical protein
LHKSWIDVITHTHSLFKVHFAQGENTLSKVCLAVIVVVVPVVAVIRGKGGRRKGG